MRLYVESNFVLELVFGQSESDYCKQILSLSPEYNELCIPAFSLFEPHFTLRQRSKDRDQLARVIAAEAKQLERSEHYRVGPYTQVRDIGSDFLKMSEYFESAYEQVSADIRRVARLIALDSTIVEIAHDIRERRPFSRMDAVVLASIITDLSRFPTPSSCFVTTDDSFAVAAAALPEIRSENCTVKSRFSDALHFVTHPR